jgi:hypothetical protein
MKNATNANATDPARDAMSAIEETARTSPADTPSTPDDGVGCADKADTARINAAIKLLAERGAGEIPHPGGTLLAHLRRVHTQLTEWAARPAVQMAGLCHAYYGTDGFATALGEVTRRHELAAIVGQEAEQLIYLYASCDRDYTYPRLLDGGFKDRFTGTQLRPPWQARQDFAELTVANELDVIRANTELRARYGRALRELFTPWRGLLSDRAWQTCRTELTIREHLAPD